ncbi:SMI1/KNR4 family protein [Streptomyces sp. NPDC059575]|uniref:SMI1/KNR4 family protein n=1 Tax=Streptomyces sp. NPDC059575 TaxID=3346872 RepID=UPI003683FC6B
MHWAVEELLTRMDPPPSGGDAVDWDEVRSAGGLLLPTDYRDFVAHYGGGAMDDFLCVFTPPVEGSAYNMLLVDAAFTGEYASEYAAACPDAPPGGLLRWGSSSTADSVFWRCGSPDPEQWTTVVSRRQHSYGESPWLEFDCGMAEFLVKLVRGELPNPFGQSGFPDPRPTYLGWREEAAETGDFDGAWGETGNWPYGPL